MQRRHSPGSRGSAYASLSVSKSPKSGLHIDSVTGWAPGAIAYGVVVVLTVGAVVIGSVALGYAVSNHNALNSASVQAGAGTHQPDGASSVVDSSLVPPLTAQQAEFVSTLTSTKLEGSNKAISMLGARAQMLYDTPANRDPPPVTGRIRSCIASRRAQSIVVATTIFSLESLANNRTFILPAYTDLELVVEENLPLPPIPGLPAGSREGFEWFAPGIPSEYSPNRFFADPTSGLPAPFVPANVPNPFVLQFPPFFNYRSFADYGHKKWWAAPAWALPFLGQDFRTHSSAQAANSIFVKNLEDRDPQNHGVSNQLKRIYMSALTCDKMPLYQPRLDAALAHFRQDTVADGKPVLSAWFDRVLLEFFIGLHAGDDTYPPFVTEYFRDFMTLLSDTRRSSEGLNDPRVLINHCRYQEVYNYFDTRRQAIVAAEDKSTLTFWWALGGMPNESLVFECIHNILAFVQYVTILFQVVRAKTPYQFNVTNPAASTGGGYLAVPNLYASGPAGPLQFPPPTRDFVADYVNAATDEAKFDVLRETYRLLLPNNFWFSRPTKTGVEEAAKNDYEQGIRGGAGHIPLIIQTINDNYNPLTGASQAATFSTARYAAFSTGFTKCPHLQAQMPADTPNPAEYPDNLFEVAAEDGETLLPKSHKEYIPVYEKGVRTSFPINGPKYCPFGLGYRRCPGELLNMWVLRGIFEEIKDYTFTMDPPMDLVFGQPVPGDAAFETAIPLGATGRAVNNLFVVSGPSSK